MSINRHRKSNTLPLKSLFPWMLIAAIVLLCGLACVQYRTKSVTSGRDIKKLEKELADLNNELETLRPKISQLSSRTALQARLNDGFIKMIPIRQDRIVQVSFASENPMRPVANDNPGQ